MGKYTGCQCIVCQNRFQENDDIVVCPDCGTPYHRSCYQAKGQCVNEKLHLSGESWHAIQEAQRQKLGGVECPDCHHVNLPDAEKCAVCGKHLHETEPAEGPAIMMPDGKVMQIRLGDPCCGFPPDEEIEGAKLSDIAKFVRTNTLYYIPLFKRFKDTGSKLSLNIPCLFFPHLYFSNRKMWLLTLLSILASVLLNIPTMLLNLLSTLQMEEFMEMTEKAYGMDMSSYFAGVIAFLEQNEQLITRLEWVGMFLMVVVHMGLSLFANWLYLRHTVKRVKRIQAATPSEQVRSAFLHSDGGTSFLNMLGAVGISYACQCAVLFVILVILLML